MSDVNFLVLTAVATIAFAFALLGVMTQWLKADEQSTAVEGAMQRKLSDDARLRGVVMSTSTQTDELPLAGSSSTAETAAATKANALDLADVDVLEAYIARHLLAWGGVALAVGMVAGWYAGSFAGALIGATIGTVVGVLAGTAVAALKRNR
jgi:hypothetical protein